MTEPSEKDPSKTDPFALARKQAEAERPKRFYTSVSAEPVGEGFEIRLDGRPLRSPAKTAVIVPARPIAEALAAEWDGQGEYIVPGSMPLTRLVNTALDGVSREREAVAEQAAAFIMSDLVCYRAEHPAALVALQAGSWDPVVSYVGKATGCAFRLANGIISVEQDARIETAMRDRLSSLDDFALAGAATVVTLTGSAALLLALLDSVLDADGVWKAAHVDEDWNIAQWGEDAEAAERRAMRRTEFDAAVRLLKA